MQSVRLIAWGAVVIVIAFLGLRVLINSPDDASSPSQTTSQSGPGGPFTLISHKGTKVSDDDFRGKHMMVYFGYSYCPDVCPLELQKLTSSLLDLEKEGYDTSPIQPLFISVDPERDTPETLNEYVPLFHPSMIGLTGSAEEIADVAKKYKVYFAKRESDDVDGYLMDHLSVIFLMDQNGNYQRLFTARDKPEDITNALRPLLKKAA
ncbi:SCO family protein [Kordiimonas sp. SCSIO 12610]|uniref:SCO family protein n=1 Tax=Kordiimonas sp. SCSIO 12610 TaxID=2829597 RepID=UPI00210E6DB1|nr:SCO family protein [Kordiimonas sp. SCSIO 12610]UTW55079.1 SCO family protein [Kordiimonas sp. SCSIO 12610]